MPAPRTGDIPAHTTIPHPLPPPPLLPVLLVTWQGCGEGTEMEPLPPQTGHFTKNREGGMAAEEVPPVEGEHLGKGLLWQWS